MWFHKIQEAKFTEQHHNDSNTSSSQNSTMIPSNFDTPSHVTSKNNILSTTIEIGIWKKNFGYKESYQKWFVLLQQNCEAKNDIIKSLLDTQTTILETVSKSTPQHVPQDNESPPQTTNRSIPSHVSQEREKVVNDCPVTDKEPESLDQ